MKATRSRSDGRERLAGCPREMVKFPARSMKQSRGPSREIDQCMHLSLKYLARYSSGRLAPLAIFEATRSLHTILSPRASFRIDHRWVKKTRNDVKAANIALLLKTVQGNFQGCERRRSRWKQCNVTLWYPRAVCTRTHPAKVSK